jgi:hypothetical protein
MSAGLRRTHKILAKALQLREVTLRGVGFSRRGGEESDNRVLQSAPKLKKNKEAASGCMA